LERAIHAVRRGSDHPYQRKERRQHRRGTAAALLCRRSLPALIWAATLRSAAVICGAIIAAVVGMLCMPAVASAHAMLERADPAVGSTVHTAPAAVSLRFSEPVEPALSNISVACSDGTAIALAAPTASEH